MGLFDAFDKFRQPKGKPVPKAPTPPPAPPKKSGELIQPSSQLPVPKKKDPWEIFRPPAPSSEIIVPQAPPSGMVIPPAPPKKDVWDLMRPPKAELAPPAEPKRGLFEAMIPADVPKPVAEPSALEQWLVPKEKPKSFTEAIIPKGEAGSLFAPEPELFKPEPVPAPRRKEEEEREDDLQAGLLADLKREAGVDVPWEPPSVDEMVKVLKEIFDLDDLWEVIRKDVKDDYFLRQLEEGVDEFGSEGARIELQTIAGVYGAKGTYIEQMFEFFGIPTEEIAGYLEAWKREDYDMGEALENIQEQVDYPLRMTVDDAFMKLKPPDIRGRFNILEYHEGLINICYVEDQTDYSPEELEQLIGAIRKEREDAQAKYEADLRRRKELKKEFLGTWKVPSTSMMLRFLEKKFDLKDLISKIRNAKKSKGWRDRVSELGEGDYIIEEFGSTNNPENIVGVARFLGIPEDVIARSYQNKDDHEMLWDEVIQPSDNAILAAFETAFPADLEGAMNIYEDEEGTLVLGYHEYAQ